MAKHHRFVDEPTPASATAPAVRPKRVRKGTPLYVCYCGFSDEYDAVRAHYFKNDGRCGGFRPLEDLRGAS